MTTKIKAQYITDKDIIYLVLPKGEYLVDGRTFSVDKYRGHECTFKYKPNEYSPPKILEVIKTLQLVHLFTAEGSTLSPDEYEKKKSELLINSNRDCDNNLYFSSIDDEYNYKKFERDWKPKYKEEITYENVELEINHMMLDTGSKYIQALFCFDTTQPNLVKFDRLAYQKDLLRSLGLKYNCALDIPAHGGLKFAKINSKYCFNNDALYSDLSSIETLMYDDAIKRMKYIENELTGLVLSICTPLTEINKLKVSDVISRIDSLSKYFTDKRYTKATGKDAIISEGITKLKEIKSLLFGAVNQETED